MALFDLFSQNDRVKSRENLISILEQFTGSLNMCWVPESQLQRGWDLTVAHRVEEEELRKNPKKHQLIKKLNPLTK